MVLPVIMFDLSCGLAEDYCWNWTEMPGKLVGFWQCGEADQSSALPTQTKVTGLALPSTSGGRSQKLQNNGVALALVSLCSTWWKSSLYRCYPVFKLGFHTAHSSFLVQSYLLSQDCRGDIQSPTNSGDAKEETEFGVRKYRCQKRNLGLAKPLTAL